jgi:8-oxo-dGTP pyrophosphatase MutT (NUDIX family)
MSGDRPTHDRTPEPGVPLARRSARVLVVDGRDRLLLVRARFPDGSHGWFTPGGGVEPGETLAEAAAREAFEETGLRVTAVALGAPVAMTAGVADLGWANGWFEDHYFFHRVAELAVDVSGLVPGVELDTHVGFAWWTVDDLRATTESVIPPGLGDLVADLIAGRLPAAPVRLAWYH